MLANPHHAAARATRRALPSSTIAAVALSASWLLLRTAVAQDAAVSDGVAEAPAVPEYRIELIVFEYTDGVRGGVEDWAYIDTGRAAVAASMRAPDDPTRLPGEPDIAAPGSGGGIPPSLAADPSAERLGELPPPDAGPPQTFEVLDASEFQLSEAAARLRASADVRPILHAAWRQPVFGPDDAGTLNLTSIARPPQRLGGSVTVFLSRYLHMTLELELADRPQSAVSGLGFGEALIYRLSEQRNKMRSDELHFFDHPRFGALARITPEPERDASPVDAPATAAGASVSR